MPVKNLQEMLPHLIGLHRVHPTPIISNTIRIEETPVKYGEFDAARMV